MVRQGTTNRGPITGRGRTHVHGRREATPDLLQRLVDGAPISMIVVDPAGTITFSSDACEQLFGYRPDELVGTNMLDYVDLEWNPLALESIGSALEASGLRLPMLFRIRTKAGSWRVVEVTANSQVDDPVVQGMAVYVRSWDEQSRLDDILEALAADHPLHTKLTLFVQVMAAETLDSVGAVLFAPDERGFTEAVAAPGLAPDLGARPLQLRNPRANGGEAPSPWEAARRAGHEQLVPVEQLPPDLRSSAEQAGYRWCWAYPVRGDGAEVEACLLMWRTSPRPMEESYLAWIRRLMRLTHLVLEQDDHRNRLTYAARHDALTGLPNRASFFEAFQDLLDRRDPGALVGVLYLDLDGFKPVNDRLGHGAGDAVLVAVARRLAHRVRQGDLMARMGGDEFAVLCPDVGHPSELETLAARLANAAREPITVGDHTVQVGASVGVSLAATGSCSIDALIEAADGALYDVKANDTGGWRMVSLPGEQSGTVRR